MAATMPAAGTTRRMIMTTGATTGPVHLRKGMRGTPTGRTRIPGLGSMVVTGTTAAAGRGTDGASPSRAAEETSIPTAGSHGAAVYSLRASSGWRTTAAQSAAGRGRRLAKDQSGIRVAMNQGVRHSETEKPYRFARIFSPFQGELLQIPIHNCLHTQRFD